MNKQIIAIINQECGVGKTATSTNFSAGLAWHKNKTLLIDLDPQAHSTVGLGIEPKSFTANPANLNDCLEGMYCHIDSNSVFPDPEQPKKYLDPKALEELANSIREKGPHQPVVVRKDETEQIILVAGKRRLRAGRMAGIEKSPAIFTQGNPLEISIIENLRRENLKPIEEAEALRRMIEKHGYPEGKLAFALDS